MFSKSKKILKNHGKNIIIAAGIGIGGLTLAAGAVNVVSTVVDHQNMKAQEYKTSLETKKYDIQSKFQHELDNEVFSQIDTSKTLSDIHYLDIEEQEYNLKSSVENYEKLGTEFNQLRDYVELEYGDTSFSGTAPAALVKIANYSDTKDDFLMKHGKKAYKDISKRYPTKKKAYKGTVEAYNSFVNGVLDLNSQVNRLINHNQKKEVKYLPNPVGVAFAKSNLLVSLKTGLIKDSFQESVLKLKTLSKNYTKFFEKNYLNKKTNHSEKLDKDQEKEFKSLIAAGVDFTHHETYFDSFASKKLVSMQVNDVNTSTILLSDNLDDLTDAQIQAKFLEDNKDTLPTVEEAQEHLNEVAKQEKLNNSSPTIKM